MLANYTIGDRLIYADLQQMYAKTYCDDVLEEEILSSRQNYACTDGRGVLFIDYSKSKN